MRLGPLGYDVMSLLCDPYVELDHRLILRLLARFCEAQEEPAACAVMAVPAGLQRLMQALGAYGFLGHVKGKRDFLRHIPQALVHLRWLLDLHRNLLETNDEVCAAWLPPPMEKLETVLATLD
jgi:aminoglycoside/choline kinase family phosphotransferase